MEMKENKTTKLRNRLFVFRNQLHKIKINEKNDYKNNQTSQYYKKKPISHFIHEREEWSTIRSIASDQHWRRRRRWPLARATNLRWWPTTIVERCWRWRRVVASSNVATTTMYCSHRYSTIQSHPAKQKQK
jgi:hypothetical protein